MLRRLSLLISALFVFGQLGLSETVTFDGEWSREWTLAAGDALEISAGLAAPDALPPNARIDVRWTGPRMESYPGERGDLAAQNSADWSKSLHALDPDVHLVYRAPVAGTYRLTLSNPAGAVAPIEYQRDTGLASLATPPAEPAPLSGPVGLTVDVRPLEALAAGDMLLEAEPNNTPEQAVAVPFASGDADQVIRVIGSADELEYFNNGASGAGPDDWFKIVYRGSRPKVFSANLQLVEPTISARMRVYKPGAPTAEEITPTAPPSREDFGNANPVPYVHPAAEILPGPEQIYTYYEGRDINERIHQQDDNFRAFITRTMQPGGTYYLRVEANQPGYELELRLFDGAPYADPKQAVAQSIYYQLAEVDAWLIHRPRNIAVHQRVRDGSSLFGENCMSCHTQSGVWGVADAFRNGYRPDGTVQNHRRLVNTMYESLRPTIKLEDAASNTSLAPNDLGDAPAGSRVAGRNIVLHERTFKPKKLQSYQQRRTANYVLLTADPQGINAAGRGSNFGPNVVFKFAAEILDRAWKDTGEERFFRGIEEKAHKIVETGDDQLKVVDDLGHRIEFFHELFPKRTEYLKIVGRLSKGDAKQVEEAATFHDSFEQQVAKDLARLLSLQQENGGWGFDLGVKNGDEWTRLDEEPDAAPTAVSLNALRAAGYGPNDAPVQRGVQWLLENQFAYGLWNKAAQTGFVTNAYAIRALSRLFPGDAKPFERRDFEPKPNETFLQELSRVRALEKTNRADFADLMIAAAKSEHSQIRRHAYLGLGGALAPEGVSTLVEGLDDPVKTAREAAFWSLRQLLLDDAGWQAAFEAYRSGDARTRQSVLQALVTRADLSGPGASVQPEQLARLMAEAMEDAHPGVRAFAFKAAWRWWVWNPGVRDIINQAWAAHLLRPEPNADAEAALRYSTTSMLIVNGQIANQTGGDNVDQQYTELSELYGLIDELRAQAQPDGRRRLERRLTAVAATHFQERGNDGGPGQLGYSTPGANETIGDIVLATYLNESGDSLIPWKRIALQGASNINHEQLQQTLLDLLRTGDLDLVAVAARALANPQALTLDARPAVLRQMLDKVDSFLADGRQEDAEALVNFLSKVRWSFEGVSEEEERQFYRMLIGGSNQAAAPAPVLGRPAPAPDPPVDETKRAALLGDILGNNRTLHRPPVFDEVSSGNAEFWLPSTEWMTEWEEGGLLSQQAIEGATEAEDLTVLDINSGRTTDQLVPDGLTSRNTILWWREGVPGGKLTFAVEAPSAGRYELITAFLYDREMGIVEFELNGESIGEAWDFYKRDLTPSGPVSLGVHDFVEGTNQLTVKMIGSNPEAEPNHIFGIDYAKLEVDDGGGSVFTKDDQGVDIISPVVAAKDDIIRMFVSWFSADTPQDIRSRAIVLANRRSLRRNPEVLKALSAYIDQEPTPELKDRIQNILNSDDTVYGGEIRKLIEEQREAADNNTSVRKLEVTDEWIADVLHFRDYVFAEMTKINESDNRACISCHGVPGRVPTLFVQPPDAAGYIPPADLLGNYRKMQQRVDLADFEKSKFLLKPLNIQTGEDDGHQGGVRYEPEDRGYQVIREWVLKQSQLQTAPSLRPSPKR